MDKFTQLRNKADKLLNNLSVATTCSQNVNIQGLLHQLDTYHIELILQYKELQDTHILLHNTHSRLKEIHYRHYEVAPVSYVALNQELKIIELNQTITSLLERSKKQ